MERNGDGSVGIGNMGLVSDDNSHPKFQVSPPGDPSSVPSCNLFLDHVGEVVLSIDSNGLSWKLAETIEESEMDISACLGVNFTSKTQTDIRFSEVYGVELIGWGLVHESPPNAVGYLLGRESQMYRFVVHGYQKSKTSPSLLVLVAYTFGHKDLKICTAWIEQINAFIELEIERPKNLLVFVHPLSGRGNGCKTWETVASIFSRAKVKTKITVTKRAGHAFDVMASIPDRELNSYDGVVSVGGDGFFNEILNGFLSSRHKAPYPPTPADFASSVGSTVHSLGAIATKSTEQSEDCDPLLHISDSETPNIRTEAGPGNTDQKSTFALPNPHFRFGIIPAGSTDAIVISTTGARDPVTSAMHIVLGKKIRIDVAQIVRWKANTSSADTPSVRYAASFAGYGFYGDVIKESERYRWMGPKRYDYAGTKVFLKHKSYEAEVSFLEVKSVDLVGEKVATESGKQSKQALPRKVICRMNCPVCSDTSKHARTLSNSSTTTSNSPSEDSRWLRSKGHYLSVGAAVISCRNERAQGGVVADAHLSDGFLHLILIKDCPRTFYLWHLTQLTRKDSDPYNFKFVEHHKTTAFTFISPREESVWNVDGEIFRAQRVSAQVFQGLIYLFASGPEI